MKPLLKSRSLHNSNDRSKYSDFVKVTRASVYSRAPNKNSDDSIHDHSKKETVAEYNFHHNHIYLFSHNLFPVGSFFRILFDFLLGGQKGEGLG